jgi:PhzF family phenazine biosynthesis protein
MYWEIFMMTRIPLFQVDAFTNEPFKGNPAGVCLMPANMPDAWMKAVASEMNLSETAFLLKAEDGFKLRWFTPTMEIELCGHATLASAHVLWECAGLPADMTLRFQTLSGWLTASKNKDWIELNFPERSLSEVAENEAVTDGLGAVPASCYTSGENLMYVYADEAEVTRMAPNFSVLKPLKYHGIIVTAPAKNPKYDFVSRFFAPSIGINEDPVTGSAHCTLTPYWRARLRKDNLNAYQASARGGELKVRASGERVYISGQAVTVFETSLKA